MIPLYGLTLFLSALLLFLVQPMVGKMILPLYGGTPAVWNTCMLFFQALLLGGYLYAHVLTTRVKARVQVVVHAAVLILPLLVLPIDAASGSLPPPEQSPVSWLLVRLLLRVGLPFFVVSSTAPLLQKWFVRTGHPAGDDPYFLYATSNCGSMLALLGYPLLMEPGFAVMMQSRLWAVGYMLAALLIVACGAVIWRAGRVARGDAGGPDAEAGKAPSEPAGEARGAPTWPMRLWWVFLAFVPSSLMLGVTAHITTNLAAVPLLWVVPLALYLLTFILVFARRRVIPHIAVVYAFPVTFVLLSPLIFMRFGLKHELVVAHLLLFFIGAMLCHGELVRRRPAASHLTEFYLLMSVGGVLGGLFNAIVAPVIFDTVLEYPLVLALACLALPAGEGLGDARVKRIMRYAFPALMVLLTGAFLFLLYRQRLFENDVLVLLLEQGHERLAEARLTRLLLSLYKDTMTEGQFGVLYYSIGVVLYVHWMIQRRTVAFFLGFGILLMLAARYSDRWEVDEPLLVSRNFFGVKKVEFDREDNYHELTHGDTIHGLQSREPGRETEPLSYYYRTGPVGRVFDAYEGTGLTERVGIIGLGAGSIACYAKPGERFTFFDIDPEIKRIAEDPRYFSYLRRCRGEYDIVLGDGRLALQQVPDGTFGILVLDVFSSDAIPIHFLTREAMRLYLEKTQDEGIILFHISNRYMDLEPLLGTLADEMGLVAYVMDDSAGSERELGKFSSRYVVIGRMKADLQRLVKRTEEWEEIPPEEGLRVWTDQYSDVLRLLRK